MSNDYSKTVHLPNTNMPSRFDVANAQMYRPKLPASRGGEDAFTLIDGPPYANGDLHMGHALNKMLKDTILKAKFALGEKVEPLRPVWDCHGLPIEWAVERKLGRNASKSETVEACAAFAQDWVDKQEQQFAKLGVTMQPKTTTMDRAGEILRVFHSLLPRLYSAKKPTLWSVVEQTSLAEAEVEEREVAVDTLWVVFPVVGQENRGVLVWTTTPWSLPANTCLAFSPTATYGWYEHLGHTVAIADDLAPEGAVRVGDLSREEIESMKVLHPLKEFEGERPLVSADYVNTQSGSGFVHVGPAHDVDDWRLWKQYSDTFPEPLNRYGAFAEDTPLVGGMKAVKNKQHSDGNTAIIFTVCDREVGWVENRKQTLKFSWRSGGLLIPLATKQWFLTVSDKLRADIIEDLYATPFYPEVARNRMVSMMENRPDWLISRQRTWGVPMGILVHRDTGEVLRDEVVLDRIVNVISADRSLWLTADEEFIKELLKGTDYYAEDYEPVTDVLDVWFDSACVPQFMGQHADLVVEGSDQHRGWFQSTALVGMMTRGKLPFDAVMTHGFVLDKDGKKFAKSAGNGVDPMAMADQYGPDVVRLWAVSSDASRDVKFGNDAMKTHAETFRKFRNTLRYLHGSAPRHYKEKNLEGLEDIELYILHRLRVLVANLREAMETYSLPRYVALLRDFCVVELSQFYFEARKDVLYCGAEYDRRRVRAVMSILKRNLPALLYPIMPFATREAWGRDSSPTVENMGVHIPDTPEPSLDWEHILKVREEVHAMLEQHRAEYPTNLAVTLAVRAEDVAPAYVFGVSEVFVATEGGDPHIVERTTTDKCQRCWRHLSLVQDKDVCYRCDKVLEEAAATV